MDDKQLDALIESVVRELSSAGLISRPASTQLPAPLPVCVPHLEIATGHSGVSPSSAGVESLSIDVPDITTDEFRYKPGVRDPKDAESLQALMQTTTARIGIGRAGPRYPTRSLTLFQADHSVTQDALMRDVDEKLLSDLGLFTVQTKVSGGKQEYLLRPDLGRQLNEDARRLIAERCIKKPQIQVCVGDGLSAEAIEANLRQIMPVIQQGCQAAGLSMGTAFFIKYCRVGVMNDIGDLIKPEVLMLLIGERPGLGRAQSMSIYMGYHPQSGHTDAERDVICNVFDNGGTNPLEAGAYAVQMAQKMIRCQAAGVKLKLVERS
jgi:ethanolamine ammonia-lyase small subunit